MTTAPDPITAARLRRARRRLRVRGTLAVAAWTLAFLALADVAMNVAYPRPKNPRTDLKGLTGYLAYGYSTVGKLRYLVRPTDAAGGKLVTVGWVDGVASHPSVFGPPDGRPPRVRLSTFGMSFSNHISHHVHDLDPSVQITLYAGPEAPPNHTFATYRAARRLGDRMPRADVVCWGILASSIKGMVTMTGLTWMFEAPAPFCYPRYTVDARGTLAERWPTVHDVDDLRAAVNDPAKMAAFRASLAAGDRFYDPVAFAAPWADRSALARLCRRAYADRHISIEGGQIDRRDGFAVDDPDVRPVLMAMAREFADTARADGRRPVVLLIQDAGSRDHLYQLLGPPLAAAGIPYLSTHDLVDTTDRANFNPDDPHFSPPAYDRVATKLLAWINAGPDHRTP